MKQHIRFSLGVLVITLVFVALLIDGQSASAVVLDDENQLTIVLDDGVQVMLYGMAASTPDEQTNKYYYLPVNLRLSARADGTPEFLFIKFVTEELEDEGGTSGALLHFLMEWGLTPEQEEDLKSKLKREHNAAQLMGSVPMQSTGETGTFKIVSATLSDTEMAPSVVTSGKAPLVPGGKAAAASKLDKYGAQLLAATFEKTRSITDLSIALDFSYSTLAPAAKGYIIFDWSKYESEYDSLKADYERKRVGTERRGFLGLWSSPKYEYSYNEMRSQYDYLIEKQVVRLQFDELIPDERVSKIRDAFFQYFLDSFTDSVEAPEAPSKPSEEEKKKSPDIRYGTKYTYRETFIKRSFKQKIQRFDLNYRMAVKWPFQLVGNMASWYDGVKNNPRCISSVNLNDPFFQHRDILFILDLDAKEMFDDTINYVTANVRKRRDSGNDFSDRVTFDKAYIGKSGITGAVTYARGEDTNPDVYEYQVQWSLRGGNIYPADPPWQEGSWEGVTLAPPVVPWTIEVEGDLGEMKSSDITRITAQVRYYKFGEEVEENIHISVAKGESLVEHKIFADRDSKGYAYRLVVNHKTEGKLALPWSSQVGDNYIYAAIPEELLQDDDTKEEAKEAAKSTSSESSAGILDRYKDELFGGSN